MLHQKASAPAPSKVHIEYAAASIATRLLIVDATVAESICRPSRPLRYDWSEIVAPATIVIVRARAGVASRAAGPLGRESVTGNG